MVTKKKFPKFLWVVREEEGTENEFLCCHEVSTDAAEKNGITHTGLYELKETQDLSFRMISNKITKAQR